jgi:protein-tyrosine-phosphatase
MEEHQTVHVNIEPEGNAGFRGVLFVCSGNTCRSAMAAAMFASQTGEGWMVESAGLNAARGAPASRGAVTVLAQAGIDLSRHRAKPIEDVALDLFPLVLVMTGEQRRELLERYPRLDRRVFLLAEMAGEDRDISDPFEGDTIYYAQTAAQIGAYLRQGQTKITKLAISSG